MGWLCPTCGKRLELWVTECPVCTPGPAHDEEHKHEEEHKEEAVGTEAATTPPAATEVKAEEAALTEATAPSAPEGAPEDEATTLLESPAAALTGEPLQTPQKPAARAPWFAYVAGVFTLAAMLFIFWPKDRVSLTVVSEPAGALVSVNDREVGETPVELGGLTRGRVYNVKLHLDGYEMLAESVLARPQEEALSFTLVRSYSPLLDEKVAAELVSQIDASGREALFSHELAGALFAVNPLIEQNPWLTDRAWSSIFQQVVKENFDGDTSEFLHHLRAYKAELAQGKTSKKAWYQHLHECEKVCRPVVTEVFKRHLEWLRRSGFTIVHFPINQYELTTKDIATIRRFVTEHKLDDDRSRQVLLVGRASRIGGQRYNLELSRKRAQAVRDELARVLADGRDRVRLVHLGFEPPQISSSVATFLGLDPSLSEAQHNQSTMLIVSEPIPVTRASLR